MAEAVKEPNLEDVGTRYEHLKDHLDSLEAVIDIMSKKALSQDDKVRLIKINNAAEVMRNTINSYSGYTDGPVQYQLYNMINSIPINPNSIEGGRGTPLRDI